MTLPAGFEEVHWRDDDALGFSAGVYRSADGKQVVVSFTGTMPVPFQAACLMV